MLGITTVLALAAAVCHGHVNKRAEMLNSWTYSEKEKTGYDFLPLLFLFLFLFYFFIFNFK
jgi:hypothetical protein